MKIINLKSKNIKGIKAVVKIEEEREMANEQEIADEDIPD